MHCIINRERERESDRERERERERVDIMTIDKIVKLEHWRN